MTQITSSRDLTRVAAWSTSSGGAGHEQQRREARAADISHLVLHEPVVPLLPNDGGRTLFNPTRREAEEPEDNNGGRGLSSRAYLLLQFGGGGGAARGGRHGLGSWSTPDLGLILGEMWQGLLVLTTEKQGMAGGGPGTRRRGAWRRRSRGRQPVVRSQGEPAQ
jgi:hypothetical protein